MVSELMNMQERIENSLEAAIAPLFLDILNESHRHAGPATDSHFRVTVVSERFQGLSPVKRHQLVYAAVADELAAGVHALALHTYTPAEWQAAGNLIPASPDCRGGSGKQAMQDTGNH